MLNKRKSHFFRKQEKFSIRKFKVGVASALIGATFLFVGNSVNAEEGQSTELAATAATEVVEKEESEVVDFEVSTDVSLIEDSDEDTFAMSEDISGVDVETAKSVTRGYRATNTVPESSAAERPTNEGEKIPTGTDFRIVDPKTLTEETTPMPEGYTVTIDKLPLDLNFAADSKPNRLVYRVVETKDNFYLVLSKDVNTGEDYARFINKQGEELRAELPLSELTPEGFVINDNYKFLAQGTRYRLETIDRSTHIHNVYNTGYKDPLAPWVGAGIYAKTSRIWIQTDHIDLLSGNYMKDVTGNEEYKNVIQAGYIGSEYTTEAYDISNYDVVEPLNADGKVSGNTYTEKVPQKGKTDHTFIDKDGRTVKVTRYIFRELLDSKTGAMKFFAEDEYSDGTRYKVPVVEPTDRKVGEPKATVVNITDQYEIVVYPSWSEKTPQRAYFALPGIISADDIRVRGILNFLKEGAITKGEAVSYNANQNTYRVDAGEVLYYYTQETAEVKFWDVTDPNANKQLGETITGIKGKGSSQITKDIVKEQTKQDVDALIEKYRSEGYEVVVDGNDFDKNPTFNKTNAEYPKNPTPTEEERKQLLEAETKEERQPILDAIKARHEAEIKEAEAKRREANKAVVNIRLIRQKGNVDVHYINEQGEVIHPVAHDTINVSCATG